MAVATGIPSFQGKNHPATVPRLTGEDFPVQIARGTPDEIRMPAPHR
ncbi:MAG: hypothetical protein RIS76_3257 [Verrucomicrobiota bacterium]|jgi:hypothetical protein